MSAGDDLDRGPFWLPALLLVLAAFGVYANVLEAPFVFDDQYAIVEDESIRSFGTVLDTATASNADGRPVVALSLAFNYALGGLDVFGYRLFNTAVHAAAAVVLFALLRRTLAAWGTAFACALIWAVHPLCTDALNMVVTRNEALCALFYVGALAAAARGFQSARGAPWYGVAVVAAFLAAGSKETAVTLPLAVLLYDRAFASGSVKAALRRHAGLYAGLAAAAAWVVLLSLDAERGGNVGFDVGIPWWRYFLAQVEITGRYLALVFRPAPLVVDHGDWSVWLGPRAPWVAGLVLVGLAAAVLWGIVRGNGVEVLGLVFFGVLAPTAVVPMSNEVAAEHRMYLPLAAVVVAAVLAARCLLRRLPPGPAPAVLTLVAAGLLAARTVDRNSDYRDPVRLWGMAREAYPENARAYIHLGDGLVAEQLPERAVTVYLEGLEARPRNETLLARAAYVLRALGREEEAVAVERRRELGGSGPRYDALGAALDELQAGRTAAGLAALAAVCERWPDFEGARRRLAFVLATTREQGLRDPARALQLAEQLCAGMVPPNPLHLDVLACALAANGRFEEARESAERASELARAYGKPGLARVIDGRAQLYAQGRGLVSRDY